MPTLNARDVQGDDPRSRKNLKVGPVDVTKGPDNFIDTIEVSSQALSSALFFCCDPLLKKCKVRQNIHFSGRL